jgi:hypothetical protein
LTYDQVIGYDRRKIVLYGLEQFLELLLLLERYYEPSATELDNISSSEEKTRWNGTKHFRC